MKTFNEEDLITWANRHEAKIGAKGYFGHSIAYLNANIKANHVYELINISDDFSDCFSCSISGDIRSYDFFLPIEAVKEEKKYRPCKSLREFYRVVMNEIPTLNMVEDDIIYDLMDSIIHIRNTKSGIEFHLNINGISTDLDGTRNVLIGNTYLSFKDLFDNSEIEINGKWLPFGVIDD